MISNKKITGKAMPIPMGVGVGILSAALITMASSAVTTWCILYEKVPVRMTGYLSMTILLSSTLIGSVLAITKVKRRKMLVSLLTGGGYLLLLFIINAVFFGGHYEGTGVSTLIILTGAIIAGLAAVKNRNSGNRSKMRKTVKLHK